MKRAVYQKRRPRVLVIMHTPTEPPGTYLDTLLAAGWEADIRMHAPGLMPLEHAALDAVDAVLIMGSPLTLREPSAWRDHEVEFVREALRRGMPYLGICLGSQLLAAALHAQVYPATTPEIGIVPLVMTSAGMLDPVSFTLGGRPIVAQWHSDTFDLPKGATRLASSTVCKNQFFRSGNAWGLQFHLEITAIQLRSWLAHESYRSSAGRVLGDAAGVEDFLAEVALAEPALREAARRVAQAWSSVVQDLIDRKVHPALPA